MQEQFFQLSKISQFSKTLSSSRPPLSQNFHEALFATEKGEILLDSDRMSPLVSSCSLFPTYIPSRFHQEGAAMKSAKSPMQTAQAPFKSRPKIEPLEDRLVPGETLTGLLLMPMGLSPLHDFLTHQSSLAQNGSAIIITDSASPAKSETLFSDPAENDFGSQPGLTLLLDLGLDQNETESRISTSAPSPYPSQDEIVTNGSPTIDLSGRVLDLSPFAPAQTVRHVSPISDNVPAGPNPGAAASATLTGSTGGTGISEQAAPAAGAISTEGGAGAGAAIAGGTAEAMPKVKSGASRAPIGLSPSTIKSVYGFNALSQTGAGQTIAIVDAYDAPNIASDLHTFDAQYGLPDPTFTKAYAQSKPKTDGGWALEISLDVEWAHAIAPAANILLVEAKTNSLSNLFGAVDYAVNRGAQIVSMSWGSGEFSGESNYDSHFNHALLFVGSAGDSGGGVEYPAASPYVVAVGGTTLNFTNGVFTSETAWSSGGGGISADEPEPTYQKNYGISLSGRGTPDVSYDADPNSGVSVYDSTPYLYYGSGWFEVGGTSAGAPQWAGLAALTNQGRSTPLTSNSVISSPFYNAATGSAYGSNYRDITSGSNGYSAGLGYDLATGLGSPLANNLVPYLITH